MRAAHYLVAVAIASAVPATAMAQSTTTTTTPAPAPVAAATDSGSEMGQWFASGYVGANFSASSVNINLDNLDNGSSGSNFVFGGQIGYTWNRIFGAEFLADFTPSFSAANGFIDSNARLVDDPRVNTYMFNAIAAIPIGSGRVQPYVSGGLGGVSIAADVRDSLIDPNSTSRSSLTRLGTNIGGGVYAFAGNVGIRTDVRYVHASTENADTIDSTTIIADRLTEHLLSGLHFWRANVGVAFRW